MAPLDPSLERLFTGIAQALFMNRLHLLRLTEIVRLHIQPNQEDGIMDLPPEIDMELRQQAVDYVLTCFPSEYADLVNRAKASWLRPA
ncbi:hypothetical protein [Haliangium ochraceum]|uniref:Uncharacterized protein n=1 Tax=Haliangium ochraceum (strain DSM 14365 / JCM 11303 / SMP-2) TaxID=502025 RepID=D0LV64_HALO1|nr:hypothetical protein [Haliangium ochraceum]ACY15905.1 hypothetical protein Hoch_3403 [Haliangium ochraceum DSM 14365]